MKEYVPFVVHKALVQFKAQTYLVFAHQGTQVPNVIKVSSNHYERGQCVQFICVCLEY